MFDLTGRTALVTGATGGIGGAITQALHAQGASVAISGTRREVLDAFATRLGERVHVLPCNLSDGAAVEALVPAAEAAMGQVDILIAKAGIIGLIKTLGAEYAKRNVTANCIAPGFIKTAMTDALNDKQRETILSKVPAARLGTPEDIAAAAVYLASNEAAYVTGQTIHVNGGMVMI